MAQRCDYCAVIPDFCAVIPDYYAIIPDFCAVIPDFYPVIPAKAGIQRVADNVIAARNPSLQQPRARYVNAPHVVLTLG